MALSSYWVSVNRRDLAERAIVARREQEARRAQKCEAVASYHRDLALKTSKYRTLEEIVTLKTPRANDESGVKERLKATKKHNLEVRQRRLAHLLAIENEQYMKELKEKADSNREKDPWNIVRLKEQLNELQKRRKEGEESIQKRYMHHLWRCNSPCAKENEEKILEKEVAEAWEQRKEKLEKLALERQKKIKTERQVLEMKKLKAAEEAREVEMTKLKEAEKLTKTIQEKVNELNTAKDKARKLRAGEQILLQHFDTVKTLGQKRKQIQELEMKGIERIASLWQPKERIRRMSTEVLHELEMEIKFLDYMS